MKEIVEKAKNSLETFPVRTRIDGRIQNLNAHTSHQIRKRDGSCPLTEESRQLDSAYLGDLTAAFRKSANRKG